MQTQTHAQGAAISPGVSAVEFDGLTSGVSWGAVLAGAAAAAALSFILLILGFGLGLSAVSPWSYNDAPVGKSTILWITFMELASAGIGGYIAGRLRVKWASVNSDEVYFRDTAHGLLAWAVATLLAAALMGGAVRAVLGGAIDAASGAATAVATVAPAAANVLNANGASGTSGAARGAANASGGNYYTDMLLRGDGTAPEADNGAQRAEVGRILATNLATGALNNDDRQYLASLVTRRTGLAQPEAERRVNEVYARMSKTAADAKASAKQAADDARKAAAGSALWMFVALLIGAFIACVCATLGGRQRDGALLATQR